MERPSPLDFSGLPSGDVGASRRTADDAGGPNAWGQVAKLTASDGAGDDFFGLAVAIDGDLVAVAADPYDPPPAKK